MLQKLVGFMTRREEKKLGASLEYVRYIAQHDFSGLLKFSKLKGLSEHRRVLPPSVFHTIKLVGAQREDCGSCVDIAIQLAKKDGVAPETIQSVLAGRVASLSEDERLAYEFTHEVCDRTHGQSERRERWRQKFGDRGVVEAALAIGSAQIFPIIKRAAGYTKACKINE